MYGRKEHKKLMAHMHNIQEFCEAHNDCNYCPFYTGLNGCAFKNAAEVPTDELWKLFPEGIMEDE